MIPELGTAIDYHSLSGRLNIGRNFTTFGIDCGDQWDLNFNFSLWFPNSRTSALMSHIFLANIFFHVNMFAFSGNDFLFFSSLSLSLCRKSLLDNGSHFYHLTLNVILDWLDFIKYHSLGVRWLSLCTFKQRESFQECTSAITSDSWLIAECENLP